MIGEVNLTDICFFFHVLKSKQTAKIELQTKGTNFRRESLKGVIPCVCLVHRLRMDRTLPDMLALAGVALVLHLSFTMKASKCLAHLQPWQGKADLGTADTHAH